MLPIVFPFWSLMFVISFRYITVEINDEEQAKKLNLHQASLHYAIQNKVKELFGDLGQATIKAGFNGMYFSGFFFYSKN